MKDPVVAFADQKLTEERRPGGPFKSGSWGSPVRSQRVASWLGVALGVSFGICLFTGLCSHFVQNPNPAFPWFAWPAGLYRVNQGAHVICGVATIPLLLAKLWTVAPRLFQWPPFRSTPHLVERTLLFPLVAGSIFLLATGVANIQYWYPWPFFFTTAHFWTAIFVIGALLCHVASQLPTVRRALSRRPTGEMLDADAIYQRRRFLSGVGVGSLILAGLMAGTTVRPLRRLSIMAPRDGNVGTQGFPVNKSFESSRITEESVSDAWRLEVTGNVAKPLSLSRSDLDDLPQTRAVLPIACVEGWSASKEWSGIRIADLLEMAEANEDFERVRFESLQERSRYRVSEHLRRIVEADNALIALRVEGEDIAPDHGYPARLMLPNQPGVRQTKWLGRVEVL